MAIGGKRKGRKAEEKTHIQAKTVKKPCVASQPPQCVLIPFLGYMSTIDVFAGVSSEVAKYRLVVF